MHLRRLVPVGVLFAVAFFIGLTPAWGAEPLDTETSGAKSDDPQDLAAAPGHEDGLSIESARLRAEVMHDLYAATLEVMHHRYFHSDRAMVPARALQDVFAEIKRKSRTEARWISASMKPMSIDHEPKGAFETQAAKEISSGKNSVEVVEDGFYRRAGAIALGNGCVSCHGGFFKEPSKKAQFAGLIISIPLGSEDSLPLKETKAEQ